MKAFLMYKDSDFDLQRKLPVNEKALMQDLELDTLINAMAQGDKFLFEVGKKALLGSMNEPDAIRYRQHILQDCLKNAAIVRELFAISVEPIEGRKTYWYGIFGNFPGSILHSSVGVMQMFVDLLIKLRYIADQHAEKFESDGFTTFFAMIKKELDDEYFRRIQDHLGELKFDDGVLISAELGKGNEGVNYVLRKSHEKKQNWLQRIFGKKTPGYTIQIHERDQAGARALGELRDRGINLVANALAQSSDHVSSFFDNLRIELAFYVGCLNLHDLLTDRGYPMSFPLPVVCGERRHSYNGLFDACLALTVEQRIVCNDGEADNKDLVIITGANQGGKSSFLRSIGVAQLMMQCGMFAPAEAFCSNICEGLFTHYKREEDATMISGKLDEELSRMSEIADHIKPNSLCLFNESFAATNEREGSEIARQIVSALIEKGVKVFFVTHLYDFAHSLFDKKLENAFFLMAERLPDGRRTFKLIEGEPLQTSYGKDLYDKIFEKN